MGKRAAINPAKGPRQSKTTGLKRFIRFCILLSLFFLIGGFLVFAQYVDRLDTPENIPAADGIVVWTGKGGGRLIAGAKLLSEEKGERLLISGVHTQNTTAQIQASANLPAKLADCCLDLDYEAKDTIGNARETAIWAKALDYDHIILVTSAYHMPRAKVEISAAAGRIRITPYPVKRTDKRRWYKSRERFERLIREYGKLLLAYAHGRNDHADVPDLVTNAP